MIYGDEAFGTRSYADAFYSALDNSAFLAFLADITAPRCMLLELDAFPLAPSGAISAAYADSAFGELAFGDAVAGGTAGVQTQRYSSQGYITQAADTPASTWYDPRLTGSVTIERRVSGRSGIGGLVRVSAEIVALNSDGALDTLTRDYAIDGRRALILVGRPTDPRSAFGNLFAGVVASVQISRDDVRISLSDGIAKLEIPVNPTTYAGTGGLEGGADLLGKPKPKGWGHVYNIAPPLVDATNLIYQVNDGAISDVPAVYDRGVLLTKVVGAPAAGQYQVNAAAGTFTLGATPAGTVTCDALLDAGAAGYINRTGDIVLRLLNLAGLTSSEIDPTSFGNLNTNAGAEVGIWIDTQIRNIDTVIDELLAGIGAFGGLNRAGAFSVGRIDAAALAAVASFTDEEIVQVTREPLPPEVEPVAWQTVVEWQKAYMVQTDLAAAVSSARRTFAAQATRAETVQDATIRGRHILAMQYAPGGELYAQQADAIAEATRRFNLWSKGRMALRAQLPIRALTCDLGDIVTLTHKRMGLAAGADGVVLSQRINGLASVELLTLV